MEKVFVKKYWVQEEAGRSDHSTVYHGTDPESEKEVALKKLRTPALLLNVQKDDTLANIQKEIESRRRFSHPGIIELYECFEHENQIYLVEEFVRGKSLAEYMHSGCYYTNLYAGLYIFQRAAEALQHASGFGYLHRNMKPENILITNENDVKLTDFMVCSLMSREQKVQTALDSDQYEYLSPYAAPETVRSNCLDLRSSVFSLGVMMYEFFTGTHPFQGRTTDETYENIMKKVPFQASILDPSVPEMINYMIDRSLRKDPQERYADFGELLQDLEYFYQKQNEPVIRVDLCHWRRHRNTMLITREVTRRFLSGHGRKLLSMASQIAARIRRDTPSGLFVSEDLEPSRIAKKRVLREEAGHDPAAVSSIEPFPAGERDIFPISPHPGLQMSDPFFLRRGTFFQENRKPLLTAVGILVLLLVAVASAIYGIRYLRSIGRVPEILPTKVIANTGTAGLMVKCNIGEADIEIIPVGTELPPVKGRLTLQGEWDVSGIASGPYSVVIKKDGYYPFVGSVTLKDNDSVFLTAEMRVMIAALEIETEPPGATVRVDTHVLGVAPLKDYDTAEGEYLLTVELAGYRTYKERIRIYKNETLTRKISLDKSEIGDVGDSPDSTPRPSPSESASPDPGATKARPSVISIQSVPDVAAVYLDGKEIGTTPLKYTVDPFKETVEISVKKKNYRDWTENVRLMPGEKHEILADLSDTSAVPHKPRTPPFTYSPPPSSEVMTLTYNVFYSKTYAFDKLSRKKLVFDFERERIDTCIKKFVESQLSMGKNKSGSFKLNVIYAIQLESDNDLDKPATFLVGAFQLQETRKNKLLFEESQVSEFSYDPASFSIEDTGNNYNMYTMTDTSGPTEKAIEMFDRMSPKFEQVIQK